MSNLLKNNKTSLIIKKLGIITSGGDCGGLNAVIYGAAKMCIANNIELVIIPNGYAGLYNLDVISPLPLNLDETEHIESHNAGSVAGHSRVKISKIKDGKKWDKIKSNIEKHSIDGLIIAGGDDTGSVVLDLISHGIKCVHVPKTMDLDLQTYSVGGDSSIYRISKFISDLKTTGMTHNRIIIFEVFGRYAGHTAFRGGIGADVDCILIPEVCVDFKIVYEHFKQTFTRRIENDKLNSATYSIVVAEGVKNAEGECFTDKNCVADSFGHKRLSGVGAFARTILTEYSKQDTEYWQRVFIKNGVYVEGINTHPEIRDVTPGHLVRCGESTPYDVSFGKQCGGGAVLLLLNNISGVTIAGVNEGQVCYLLVSEAIKQRYVNLKDVEFYEKLGVCFGREINDNYKPELKKISGYIERYM
jgi:6-phosphofructokinase 1